MTNRQVLKNSQKIERISKKTNRKTDQNFNHFCVGSPPLICVAIITDWPAPLAVITSPLALLRITKTTGLYWAVSRGKSRDSAEKSGHLNYAMVHIENPDIFANISVGFMFFWTKFQGVHGFGLYYIFINNFLLKILVGGPYVKSPSPPPPTPTLCVHRWNNPNPLLS